MNKELSELPNGWLLLNFNEAINKISTVNKKIKTKDCIPHGRYPVVDQGKEFIGGYTDRESLKIECSTPMIVFGDHTRVFKYIDFDFVPGADGIKVLRPKDFFNSKLFYYFIQKVQLPNKGYARHFQFLEKVDIPLPPFAEQTRIVAKIEELFSNLDAGVAALEKVRIELKRYRQTVLKAAFEGKFVEDFTHKETLLGEFERMGGGTPNTKVEEYWNGDIEWITSANIDEKNKIHYDKKITEAGVKNSSTHVIPNGSVILVTRVGLGKVAVNDRDVAISQDCQGILCKGVNPFYVMWQLKSIANEIIRKGQGTTINGITINKLDSILLKVPNNKTQGEIVDKIERYLSVADKIERTVDYNLKQTEKLRQSILKKAFEGRLVPQDLNDEPASVLLERIKAEKMKAVTVTKKRGKKNA